MQIETKAGPTILQPPTATSMNSEARTRAISKFMEGGSPSSQDTSQQHPVRNPSQISPEEISAIRPSQNTGAQLGQINPNEASQTSEQAASPESTKETLSSQYAILARKERSLRLNAQKLKAQQDAMRAQAAQLKAREEEMKNQYISREQLKQDPFGTLNQEGISYEQIANQALNQPSYEEQALKKYQFEMDAKFKKLEEEQQNTKQSIVQEQQRQYDQAIHQIKNEVRNLVSTDPSFETIKTTRSANEVVTLIVKTFEEGLSGEYPKGSILPIDVAAQLVEDQLVEELTKVARIKKIQERIQPSQQAVPKATYANLKQSPMRTLSNQGSSAKSLSARERAILAFNNQLK